MMKFYVITLERAKEMVAGIRRGVKPGTYDWFVNTEGVFQILFNVNGVNYIYRTMFKDKNEIDPELLLSIGKHNEILGIDESVGSEDEQDDVVEVIDINKLFEVK